MDKIEDLIGLGDVIPVLNFTSPAEAVDSCLALYDAGLRVFEITLRHQNALLSVSEARASLPDDALIGAGTIVSPEQLSEAKGAGAQFGVSPGLTRELGEQAQDLRFPFLPGIATVSEAMEARDMGFSFLKFFPAEVSGGTGVLKAVSSILPELKFCPTGGIVAANAYKYLALPNVPVVGGSWLLARGADGAINLSTSQLQVRNLKKLGELG